jgi:hypothetical protein
MSYEICVFEAAYAGSKEAAAEAWNESSYWDTSRPDYERSARKWHIKDALMAFNPALTCSEPEAPPTGFLAKTFRKPPPDCRYLMVNLTTRGQSSSFEIYDQAVDIDLSWDASADEVQDIVREVWRHLEKLVQMGFGTIYDTERDVLLNLETDFDAVLQGYVKNLEFDDAEESASDPVPSVAVTQAAGLSVPREKQQPISDAPFAGNVEVAKPWWKLW